MSVKYVNCIIDSCDTPASSKVGVNLITTNGIYMVIQNI